VGGNHRIQTEETYGTDHGQGQLAHGHMEHKPRQTRGPPPTFCRCRAPGDCALALSKDVCLSLGALEKKTGLPQDHGLGQGSQGSLWELAY
jgi:hypothetical protein